MTEIHLQFIIDQKLHPLLYPRHRVKNSFSHVLTRRASIKDVLESLRIPHTEIGELIVNSQSTTFSYHVKNGDEIQVLPPTFPMDPCTPSLLRPEPLKHLIFLTDANVGKLCSLLRMTGFDCVHPPLTNDADIAVLAVSQNRILLSRDRDMLKRKIIIHGRLIRSIMPADQLKEVLAIYGLKSKIRPFSRCICCNALLQEIEKEKILHRLEPLTKKYYQHFFHCPGCDKIYWSGSHKIGMERVLSKVLT